MKYELTIVAHPTNVDALVGRVEKSINDAGVNGLKTEKLGKKKLAYPIKRFEEAEYVVFNFEAEGFSIKPVWDKLRLEQEDLLRYLFLTKPVKKPRRVQKKAEPKKEEPREEQKPKVTVVTKQATAGRKQEAKNVSKEKVDAKAKGKVASKTKAKGKSKK